MDNDSCGPSDAEIVCQVVAGSLNAFEQLLKKYQNHVLRILKKRLPYDQVKDTAQDVFIRAYQSLPTFKGDSSFEQWLSTIAVRACYDFWRKHSKSREFPMSFFTEKHQVWLEEALSDQSSQSFHERGLQKEAREILDWALERLSAEDRMVLEMVYLEGHSVKEAACLLGWSTANVKVRSFRSRKKLHKLLSKPLKHRRRET
jgi:RNA polymerase sigma-70 factor (ECF subfamily)